MVLITLAVAMYKKHHDAEKKNEEIKELAHDGNFTLPEEVPSIPADTEAGQHWRLGVDPAAKGAVHHDNDLQFIGTARNSCCSIESGSGSESADELWDEVAEMVECPTPRQSDYFDPRDAMPKKAGSLRRGPSYLSEGRSRGVQRSGTVMSAASTDSWTSRYSCMTDGRRYDEDDDDYDAKSVKFF